jgi:Tfp pilus assembly protein PilF
VLAIAGWVAAYLYFHIPLWQAQRAFRQDLLPEASAAINSYLERRPNDVESHLLASRIERLRGNLQATEKHLEEYKRLAGTTERSQLEWLLARAMGGELASVEIGLKVSLEKKDPDSILILEALVFSYMKDFRFGISLYYLEKWLKQEPDNVRALWWRGWCVENYHTPSDAKEDYQRVLDLSPNHTKARLQLVNILLLEKNVQEATEHLNYLQRDHGDDPEVLYSLVLCRILQGETEEAEALLDRVLVLQPNNTRALYQRGNIALDDAEKEKWYRKALQVDPTIQEAQYALVLCLQKQPKRAKEAAAEKKKYEETVKNWENLKKALNDLEKSPGNPDLLVQVGKVLLPRSSMIGLEFLYKALNSAPDHQGAHQVLAEYFEKTNQPEKAARHRKKLAELK